jgi:hypothetical protein
MIVMYHNSDTNFSAKSKSILRCVSGRSDLYYGKNSWFTCDGNLPSWTGKHAPEQLPIREVYQPILKELEEYVVLRTVHRLDGYKPDNTK